MLTLSKVKNSSSQGGSLLLQISTFYFLLSDSKIQNESKSNSIAIKLHQPDWQFPIAQPGKVSYAVISLGCGWATIS